MSKTGFAASSLFVAISMANAAMAQDSELIFESEVTSVTESGTDEGFIEVKIHDAELPVLIYQDTEIGESGEDVSLSDVMTGDFVEIVGFFSQEGLVAEAVEILDMKAEQFRLNGSIESVFQLDGSDYITVLGIDVEINQQSKLYRREFYDETEITAGDLSVGDPVNISGEVQNGKFAARWLFIGEREEGAIELEGDILEVNTSSFVISLDGGAQWEIQINSDTQVEGELVQDTFVEVEGRLQQDLSLLAFGVFADEDGDGDADDEDSFIYSDDDDDFEDDGHDEECQMNDGNSGEEDNSENADEPEESDEDGCELEDDEDHGESDDEVEDGCEFRDEDNDGDDEDDEDSDELEDGSCEMDDDAEEDESDEGDENNDSEDGDGDAESEDSDEGDDSEESETEYELSDTNSGLQGVLVTESESGDESYQAVFLELEGATPDTGYEVILIFGSNEVSLGSVSSDGSGILEVEAEEDALTSLLPDNTNISELSGVRVEEGGNVVLEATF